MGQNLAQKIIGQHLVAGKMVPGEEIAIRIDQTLTQDATGTMAYLQLEAMGVPRVRTRLSVSYVDHNTLQTGFENADDHLFLQGIAAKYGIIFSRPGNGICHQVHLERFAVPGTTLLGSDSHTPTAGGLGALGIGAGGLDVAVAMAGGPFYFNMPAVVRVNLHGRLAPWVSAKDIILEVLRRLSVKGGVGKVIEYGGDGVATLSVPERATITNMGAELGATTSIFPSDAVTRAFLTAQGRAGDWVELLPDADATYEQVIDIDLAALEPLVARPHMPDNVAPVREVGPIKVNQVAIGSCTNSSYTDLMRVAAILRGKRVHPDVSLVIAPGSRQVFRMLAKNGALADLITAGARILECACGPCIGMGQAPPSGGVSVRTFNRNFQGRSGTADALIYLASPEVAAATALKGYLTDPRELGEPVEVALPESFPVDDGMFIFPPEDGSRVEVRRGPNIKPLPLPQPPAEVITAPVLLKVGDNITTDHISPAGARYLPLRSNIPALAEHAFEGVDPTFARRAKEAGQGIIVGGQNYGQGSSREHAALCPMYLGIKAVIAKSFARIHRSNLVNFGILPLTFADPDDYDRIAAGDTLAIDLSQGLEPEEITVTDTSKGFTFKVRHDLSPRQQTVILAGGLLNYTKQQAGR
ncbi:aconitate hydratase [Neomoorella thermoacetica]|uniref:aconitate hydratase n=1 Tax=Neomoorella thermoacetica TaxID=1525 RepID=UPI0008FB219E|nr:aconitate hydratase [Moorella thermoacetica]APC09105.1 2,3-dimethylmalate dehydratase large subunit [Moorella thermoacetica]OIQ53089.1 2,3-dimethylmalate dehydratase large subunit [Moorella thermoacetica]